jgi:class 3 adenylate cyclase
MPRFIVPKSKFRVVEYGGKKRHAISKAAFDSFNIKVLGLGDVSAPSEPTDAVAAVFDLARFTNFCKQIDPHLSVPYYLNAFLTWLMSQLREEMLQAEFKEGMRLWCPLPFFVKFLGDGLLVLWNAGEMNDAARRNVVIELANICHKYAADFVPTLTARIVELPPQLRCGLARGTVFSVGDGQDYVDS